MGALQDNGLAYGKAESGPQGEDCLSPKQALAQKAVSWFAIALGTLPGFYGLVMFCQNWVPEDYARPDWLALWLQAAGLVTLGLVFLIASFAARQHRRRAGLWFLLSAPIAAFCLSFEDSYFGVPFRGYNSNQPSLAMAALFVCAFFAPLYAPLMSAGNKKRAVYLVLVLAPLSGMLFRFSPWSIVILPRLLEFSAPFLVFGAFWSGTGRLGWPPLGVARLKSLPGRLAAASIGSVGVAILVFAGTLAVSAKDSRLDYSDCGVRPLFARPLNSGHAVFTARAIRAGHFIRISGKWAGYWAIGLVQERFWGLPWWSGRLVLLTTHAFLDGETYLIDGQRDPRLLNRFLPIVKAGPCTYTSPVADAGIELRLLRDAPPPEGFRIVGRVEDHLHPKEVLPGKTPPAPDWNTMTDDEINAWGEQARFRGEVTYRRPVTPLPGAKIRVAGSSGSTTLTAGRDGIYQAAGLPADRYRLELLDVPATQHEVPRIVEKSELIEKKLVWADLHVFWDGAIEGRIRDSSGDPAKLWLHLERADGMYASGSPTYSQTDGSGAFSFGFLPPGRYILRINEDGPNGESPYAPQYYPSSESREGAHVFELGEGRHIRNVDLVLRRLHPRRLQVGVTWPDGRPADEAAVHIAYGHTDPYDQGGGDETGADRNGIADLTVFSGSHIRVWAEKLLNEGRRFPTLRYSNGIELDTDKLPPRLDLEVISRKPPFR